MKNLLVLTAFFAFLPLSATAKMTKTAIYNGKVDAAKINRVLTVAKLYATTINKEKGDPFRYDLRTSLSNEDLNAGIYKTTEYKFLPVMLSKQPITLKSDFKQVGQFKFEGETISFDGELWVEGKKIGTIGYRFNMYDLPIGRVYNPKVSRTLENTAEGFSVIENREISD